MSSDTAQRGWLQSLGIYRNPRVAAMLLLGFSSGLPFVLTAGTMAAWFTRAGISMAEIGLLALIGILYGFKFVWAPLLDNANVPLLSRVLGHRRSWMLLAQLGVTGGLFGMSLLDPIGQLDTIVWLAILVAFSSATQDIAVDAWRIEIVPAETQGAMAAAYQLGYRIALLVSGGGALSIGLNFSYGFAYQVMALLMGIGMLTVMVVPEPDHSHRAAVLSPFQDFGHWLNNAIVRPFAEFFERFGKQALIILLFIGIYRVSDTVLGVMANPFYLQTGFNENQIFGFAKTTGAVATVVGAVWGGVAVAKQGLGRTLVFGAVILALTNLAFAGLAIVGKNIPVFVLTICADSLAQGFTGTVFIAYLSSLTSASHTATQYALFTSIMVLPGKFLAGVSGFVVEATNWITFFIYASLMGLPAILLAVYISRRLQSDQSS